MAAVLEAIHARAPGAKVFLVGYGDIVPTTGSGCWPSVPFAPDDVGYLDQVEVELNAMLAAEAASHGATYVNDYAASVGHDACQAESKRWIEPLVPWSRAAPFHPNAAGMAHFATVLIGAMRAAGL